MGKTASNISIIGGSDGPTAVFLGGKKQRTIKQRIQKCLFELRKKWFSIWVKPNAHTMEEVICYLKDEYGFTEVAKDAEEYVSQYDSLMTAFILQYEPKLTLQYEEVLREGRKKFEIREQKAKEIPEEKFPLGFHILKKAVNESEMHFYIESRFGYLGGGFSSSGKDGTRKFGRIYKAAYRYYGVTAKDIAKKTERYEELLTTLAGRY